MASSELPIQIDESTALAGESIVLKRCLWRFIRHAWHLVEDRPYIDVPHLRVVAGHLERLTAGDFLKFITNLPPACGKSLVISVLWPCWVWVKRPESRWIFASYGEHLSTRFSLLRRRVLDSDWFQVRWPDVVRFSPDQNAKTEWQNASGGSMVATSVRGRLTGEHPDFVVIDDANDVRKVESVAERQAVNAWWDGVVVSRGITREVRRVIVQQRTATNDLTGHVLSGADAGDWCRLVLPMRAEPDEAEPTAIGWVDERRQGELLCPELLPEDTVRELELAIGSQRTAGQLQQRPVPPGGSLFRQEHFRYFKVDYATIDGEPRAAFILLDDGSERRVWQDECWWFQTCDTAYKEGDSNDYTVVLTAAVTPPPERRLLVVHVYRERLPVPRQFGMLMEQRARWPRVQVQGVEDKASGIGLIQEARLRGTPFRALKTGRESKTERATAILTAYQNGLVYHKAGEQWTGDFENELCEFPAGAYADQVDVTSYAGIMFQEQCYRTVQDDTDMVCYPARDEDEREEEKREDVSHLSVAEQITGHRLGESPRRDTFGWR